MSRLDETAPAPRKVMTIFYVVDTSGSMSGTRIGTVNTAIQDSLLMLKDVANANDDADIRVAILQFSDNSSWVTSANGPVPLNDVNKVFNNLVAGGLTNFGSAIKELNSKLSRKEFLNTATGAYAPVIILMTDGEPTENEWPKELKKIKDNNWFKYGIKIAIDIESGSNRSVLADFTGSDEVVLDAKDSSTLSAMIKFVSVRSSQFQSRSSRVDETDTSAVEDAEAIVNQVKKDIANQNNKNSIDWNNGWGDWGD